MMEFIGRESKRAGNRKRQLASDISGATAKVAGSSKENHLNNASEDDKLTVSKVSTADHHIHHGSACAMFVGAHMSITGGLYRAILDAESIGCKAFAIFLRNQRRWNSKPLDDSTVNQFKQTLNKSPILAKHIVPHGSYLMNCGSANEELLKKSRAALLEDVGRCERLGIPLFNFHPGATCGLISVEECCRNISESIDYVHEKTNNVVILLENMAGQGTTIGSFQEIANIISKVKDKSKVGVCLDTCHAFAAGHCLNTREGFEKMMDEFSTIIGIQYLKAVHLNDSKGEKGCRTDRHENIGKGKIGRKCFEWIMNDPRFSNLPLVLETPVDDERIYEKEIKLLYSMCQHLK